MSVINVVFRPLRQDSVSFPNNEVQQGTSLKQ